MPLYDDERPWPPPTESDIPFDEDDVARVDATVTEVSGQEPKTDVKINPISYEQAAGRAERSEEGRLKAESKRKPGKSSKQAVPVRSGEVYVLLNTATNEYEIIGEDDLIGEAANILRNGALQLVKGQYFAPEITFKPVE